MAQLPAVQSPTAAIIERVVAVGDLSDLTPAERVAYYRATCESLGLNPLTRPFEYIRLNGKLVLYARRDCTDQLRRLHKISITIVSRDRLDDIYVVTARATTPDGRADESIGAVSLKGASGDALANLLMKAETKAKRRATLSLVGLGWLDETEVETIPDARIVSVEAATGEMTEERPASDCEPRPAQPVPADSEPRWTTDQRYIKGLHAFLAHECQRTGLSFPATGEHSLYERVKREALGVEHIRDYTGSRDDAKRAIREWFDREAARQAGAREAER